MPIVNKWLTLFLGKNLSLKLERDTREDMVYPGGLLTEGSP